jgi:Zn-dependent protease
MRDPFSWSFPIGRLFGITVRVHILLIVVFLGLYLRVATGKVEDGFKPGFGLDILAILGLAFISVLLHEFGHCYGARLVDGDAQEVLLWPLGGLAFVDVPHTPWANFIATVMGPAVNLFLCIVTAVVLASASLAAPWWPVWDFFGAPLWNWAAGGDFTNAKYTYLSSVGHLEWWQLLAARLFFVNWLQFLLNVLVLAYPMDGGRLLQSALWPRMGYRRATLAAVFVGFVFMFVIGVASLAKNEVFFLALALFIFASCRQQWLLLETGGEDALFGYDFSQGYTSLERDQEPPPKVPRRKRPNFFQRWLQRRAQKKLQAELERHEADERRMDQLLEKIQREGRESLTDEENRFLKRVADKYRNRP